METRLIVEIIEQYLDRQPRQSQQAASDKIRIRLYMALRLAILDRALPQETRLPPTVPTSPTWSIARPGRRHRSG